MKSISASFYSIYLAKIKKISSSSSNEHSFRNPLQNLFYSLFQSANFQLQNLAIVEESNDKEIEIDGTPDFFIYKNYGELLQSLIGFIECKKINYDLNKLIDSNQIKKYSQTTENIIITNLKINNLFFLLKPLILPLNLIN